MLIKAVIFADDLAILTDHIPRILPMISDKNGSFCGLSGKGGNRILWGKKLIID
jgi:hypothetical protein